MKQSLSLLLGVIFIHLNNAYGVSRTQLNKECQVKEEQIFSLLGDDLINVSFFITPDDPISIQVYFEDRKKYEENSLLILKPDCGKIQQKSEDHITTYNVTLDNCMHLGWNNMNITTQFNTLDIGNFYTLTGFEYTINEISFSAKYMTDCVHRTPVWEISKSKSVYIPLNGLSYFGIKLVSDQLFHPGIAINSLDIPLSYDEELLVQISSEPLPLQDYNMVVKRIDNTISLFEIFKNESHHQLMKFATKKDLLSLEVISVKGNFFIVFDPFLEKYLEEETKTPAPTRSTETSCPNDSPSCTVWKIITGLAIGIAVAVVIPLIYLGSLYRNKHKKLNMEDSEESVPLLNQDSINSLKYSIKSTSTETLEKPNLQENPCKKEVYRIKLRSDNKFPNKKILGEFDSHKPTKVILVVGQTASGKSSFINTMINYVYGVTYDDTFRFKLVDDINESNIYGTNNTEEITSYYIPFSCGMQQNCNFIFIDTPGFGDIRGVDEDKKWNQKFYEFLQNSSDISQVDGICFLIRFTDTRLTFAQKYIIDGLFSMFGKDINNNIFAIVSHSDGSKTHVPDLLKDSSLNYKLVINFNSIGIYNDKKIRSESQEKIDNYFRKYWDLSMKDMKVFFKFVMETTAVSLSLTNIVLEENKDIESLKDGVLELMAMEHNATDRERQKIQSRIEQNQELLMIKLDEAQKLSGRLESIPAKKNPLIINEYIDRLIKSEKNEEKVLKLKKLKDRNTAFQKLMKEKSSTKSLVNLILGEKTKKTE